MVPALMGSATLRGGFGVSHRFSPNSITSIQLSSNSTNSNQFFIDLRTAEIEANSAQKTISTTSNNNPTQTSLQHLNKASSSNVTNNADTQDGDTKMAVVEAPVAKSSNQQMPTQ